MDKTAKQVRIDLSIPGTLTASDRVESPVTVRDLSQDGCRLDTDGSLVEGETVLLKVGKEVLEARVRWALGEEAGLLFLSKPKKLSV